MSEQAILETRELEDFSIDYAKDQIHKEEHEVKQNVEENLYEDSKREEVSNTNSILKDLQSTIPASHCPAHPEEELQFYCFNTHTTLCAECLVKGGYSGKDIANLKKSADRLKLRLQDMALETTNKLEAFDLFDKEVAKCGNQVEESMLSQKREIQEKMNALRHLIDLKEQELFEKLGNIQGERFKAVTSTTKSLQNNKEEMQNVKDLIEHNIHDMNDLSVCDFYSKKAEVIKNHFNDEVEQKIQRLKKTLERHHFQDEVNLGKFQESTEKVKTELSMLGSEIGKNKFEVLTLSAETTETVVKTKSPKTTTFFKEDSTLNKTNTSKEILLVQNLTPREATSKTITSYLPKKTYMEQTSAFLPYQQFTEKATLMIDRGRESRNKYEGLKGPFFMYNNPMLSQAKEKSTKMTESKDYSSTTKLINFEAPHPKSSTLNNSRSAFTKVLDSILVSKSPQACTSKSRLFESETDQMKSCRTISDVFGSSEQFKLSKKSIHKGSEGLVDLDFGSLLSSKKVQKKTESVLPKEGRLKQKLEMLNCKLFN